MFDDLCRQISQKSENIIFFSTNADNFRMSTFCQAQCVPNDLLPLCQASEYYGKPLRCYFAGSNTAKSLHFRQRAADAEVDAIQIAHRIPPWLI